MNKNEKDPEPRFQLGKKVRFRYGQGEIIGITRNWRVNDQKQIYYGVELYPYNPTGRRIKEFAEDDLEEVEDTINHPPHYTKHPSGVECIQITEHMNFNLGNAIKYIWRAGEKGDAVEDL
ncbi:MAG: hypothetical protein CV087_23840, partial [Candidatus Brocadia sp. WS118]